MDQLYEGATVCRMWRAFSAEARALGYATPLNRMPCDHASNLADPPVAPQEGSGAEAPTAVAAACSTFRWALEAPEKPLADWLASCGD